MHRREFRLSAAVTVFSLFAAAGLLAKVLLQSPPKGRPDSAPGRTARRLSFGGYMVAGRTVTIAVPRHRIYEMWRDPQRLADFMQDLTGAEVSDDRVTWIIDSPDGRYRVDTQLVLDRKDEALAWRSVEGADIQIEAKVQFRDAAAGRGTEVEAHVAWRPHGGIVGHWAAALRRTDPAVRGRQELKRLKMLLETGEIATSANRRDP